MDTLLNRYTIPLLADAGAVLLSFWLLPRLRDQFAHKKALNAAIIAAVYVAFCMSVYMIRKLDGVSSHEDSGSLVGALGIFFAIMLTFMMADAGGLLDRIDSLPSSLGWLGGLIILLGTLAWLAVIFLYPAILWSQIKPAIGLSQETASFVKLASLGGINLMILVTVAHWEVYFSDTQPYDSITIGAKVLIFLCVYAFFLIFYAPPRMLFFLKNPSWFGVFTFFMQTGYYVWRFLVGRAW